MLSKNSDVVMMQLKESDVVLDIGGWAHPFNRANYVMDNEPFETRGYYNRTFARSNPVPAIGGTVEYFDKSSWIRRDVCGRAPYPFADKELDFVICSHTLEDLRDPLWVCSEMIRIGKAGYIEVPSRFSETCRGAEPGIAGLSHHRWLVEIDGNTVRFLPKYHRIHNWRYSLPASLRRRMSEDDGSSWMFWHESFQYMEVTLHGDDHLLELQSYVDRVQPYPALLLAAHRQLNATLNLGHRLKRKLLF
jgi:hypothetical protein